MERLDELLNSCFKPKGSFHFRTLPELTDFIIEQGCILYPVSIHYSFGYFNLEYLIDDPEDKEVESLLDNVVEALEEDKCLINEHSLNHEIKQLLDN